MTPDFTLDDLLLFPACKDMPKQEACDLLGGLWIAGHVELWGRPNAAQTWHYDQPVDCIQVPIPQSQAPAFRIRSALGGCAVRATVLTQGDGSDRDIKAIVAQCRGRPLPLPREFPPSDVLICTDLLFSLDEEARVRLYRGQETPPPQEPKAPDSRPSEDDIKAIVHNLVDKNGGYMAQDKGAKEVRKRFRQLVNEGYPLLNMEYLKKLFAHENGTTKPGPKGPRGKPIIK